MRSPQHPDDEDLWLLYGHLLREVGQQTGAIDAYRHALGLRPGSGRAYWSLANLKTFRFSATELAAMQDQAARESVRGDERIHLEFALGKALEDNAEYRTSFEHYARANALERATIVDDPEASTAELERSRKVYTQAFFNARAGWGLQEHDPIFIVGVPRSGSTLLEQILASHSQIEGTRELAEMVGIVREVIAGASAGKEYPQPIAQLTPEAVKALAARYLERTRLHRALGKPRFIDKMLGNWVHIGLIQLMFPHAVIIDARRHPLACGFACYKQLFTRPLAFTYNLEEFARYFREYHDFMEYIDATLPGRVYRVHYEHLIADPENQVRRLLDHCGLEFESQCMRFHENPRAVLTISSEQVRRPIYKDSVDQWRHYEPWLGPLQDALADLAAAYPRAANPTG